jgi:hypothetical protein
VCEPLLQSFPFPSTLGEVTLHLLSQTCMFIYSSSGKWVFPPLLWSFPPTTLLQAFPLLIAGRVLLLLPAGMFVYSSCGKWAFPSLLWSFPPSATLTCFPAPGCWACPCSQWSLSCQAQLVYLQFRRDSPPPLRCSGHPTLFAMCLYCSYCLLLSFSFFPRWGSVSPRGSAYLAQGCLWKYHVPLS